MLVAARFRFSFLFFSFWNRETDSNKLIRTDCLFHFPHVFFFFFQQSCLLNGAKNGFLVLQSKHSSSSIRSSFFWRFNTQRCVLISLCEVRPKRAFPLYLWGVWKLNLNFAPGAASMRWFTLFVLKLWMILVRDTCWNNTPRGCVDLCTRSPP